MGSMTIAVPAPLRGWVQSRVEEGGYADAGEYVRDLIRRDQERVEERAAVVAALVEGEGSGVSARSVPDILAEMRREGDGGHDYGPRA